MKTTTLDAYYELSSTWELDFDLDQVDDWGIKWDVLYVRHQPNGEYEEYYPDSSASGADGQFKYPCNTKCEIYNEDGILAQ